MYTILEVDSERQRDEANNQRLNLTNTIASQQRMLQSQQSSINAMDHRILTLSSQSLRYETTIEGHEATMSDQKSSISNLEQRQNRWMLVVRDLKRQLNTSEATQESAQRDAARLEKEVARLAEQNERFLRLMERGEDIAAARIEQTIAECEAKLELKNDKIAEQAMLIKSLQAQVARIEGENHDIKGVSEEFRGTKRPRNEE